MSTAAIDSSNKQSITARLKTDGVTITRVIADASNGALKFTTDTSGAVTPASFSATDENGRTSWLAVSENDPTVLVALQCDSNGALLVKLI